MTLRTMFKAAAAFTVSKGRKHPVSTAIGMDKQMCYIHTMEYYSIIKDVVALNVSKRKKKDVDTLHNMDGTLHQVK